MEKLSEIGELEAIRRLTNKLGGHSLLRTGAGDDCAVTAVPDTEIDQVFTTDPVIQGIHFQPADRPERIGNKAAGRVLSDIAAMGAHPQWLLVNVVAPPEQNIQALEQIYAGMTALCNRFGATLIGGDLARGPRLELHVFGTGTLPSGSALLRSGAKPGDSIFVTGALGCSLTGRHLDFTPRVEEGIFLRESGCVHAMMDISDGLATDLRHILKQSGVGARLVAEQIPANGTLDQALYDGEDFELLLAAASDKAESLCRQWQERFAHDLFLIGTVTAETEVLELRRKDGAERLKSTGYEHFSNETGKNDRP